MSDLKINHFWVTGGPSEDELLDALKYAFERKHPDFEVTFVGSWNIGASAKIEVTARITGVTYEGPHRGRLIVSAKLQTAVGSSWDAVGTYSTTDRTGHFQPGRLVLEAQPVTNSTAWHPRPSQPVK